MSRLLTGAMLLAVMFGGGSALAQKTVPDTVTLTPKQWACMKARMPKILAGEGSVIQVPMSPCTDMETRAPGAGNATTGSAPTGASAPAARSAPIPKNVTRAPLYLSKEYLACIQQQLPKLAPATPSTQPTLTIDLKKCQVAP